MKYYIVSLANAESRRSAMRAQLDALGVDYEIIDAVDGRALTEDERARYCDFRKMKRLGRMLSPGEIGCALSHLEIYRRMASDGPAAACILEDDVILSPDYATLAERAADRIAGTRSVQLLGESVARHYGYAYSLGGIYRGTNLRRAYGTFSYVITREAAAVMHDFLRPVCRVADCWGVLVSRNLIRLYGISYTPCMLSSGLADTAMEMDRQRTKGQRSGWLAKRIARVVHGFWKRYYAVCGQ